MIGEIIGRIEKEAPEEVVEIEETIRVDPETEVTAMIRSPVHGKLLTGQVHFPDGCGSDQGLLVHVVFIVGGRRIPQSGAIAGNDTVIPVNFYIPVEIGQPIFIKVRNEDIVNYHEIAIKMTFRGKRWL